MSQGAGHEVIVRRTDNDLFWALCITCHDRSNLETDYNEAQEWADLHAERSKAGNMNQPHTMWRRETAAKVYRQRSEDPRWTEEERLLWAQMADELESPPDEGQDALF